MTQKSLKILCCSDYFLPGYAGGGPIRTIANMRKLLTGDVELAILTRDRDLGGTGPYEGIAVDTWNETPDGRVFYASPSLFGVSGFQRCVRRERFDLIYLNSFFSPRSSIQPYLWIHHTIPNMPVLLAPRGEFSPSALALKQTKKRAFLNLARTLGLYRNVQWHASTAAEEKDILRHFPNAKTIYLAEDPVTVEFDQPLPTTGIKANDRALRIIFISRISPMKNLDGLLRIISTLSCRTELDIFGPIEDKAYWRNCENHIKKLPPWVRANYYGPLAPESVSPVFAGYDLFVFPTLGENFGHVVFESLRAGTPVVLSDRTPWRSTGDGVVTAIPLENAGAWRSELLRAADQDDRQKAELRAATRAFAETYARQSDSFARNLVMFRMAACRGDAADVGPDLGPPGWGISRG